jgi:hypothetical protein
MKSLRIACITLVFTCASSLAAARADMPLPSGGVSQAINRALDQAWTSVQTTACGKIKSRLEQPNALQPGLTAYDVSCAFGPPGAFTLDNALFSKGVAGVAFAVPRNSLEFRTHSKGMPGFFDPKFHVGYDLDIVSHLSASLGVPPIVVDDAVANATNVKVRGGNVAGTIASAFISRTIDQSIDLKQAFSDALAQNWRR